MDATKVKLEDLEKSQAKTDEIISKILTNPGNYDKGKLLKLVGAMKDLVAKAESKLTK